MAKLYSLLVRSGILVMLLVTVLATDGAIVCEEKDDLGPETDGNVDLPSECVLSCTSQTYGRMLLRRDTRTVRFKSSVAGAGGEYCWSSSISCSAGERLLHVYVILPASLTHEASLALQTRPAMFKHALSPHRGPALPPDACGLRFDVTDYFGEATREPKFCVEVVPQQRVLEEGPRCPPFLVTVWQK